MMALRRGLQGAENCYYLIMMKMLKVVDKKMSLKKPQGERREAGYICM